MKNLFFRAFGISIFLGCAMLTSCSKSNEQLLDEYQKIGKEVVQATKDGDLLKIEKLAKKGESIEKELQSRDLTETEKEKMEEIEYEISVGMAGAASDKLNDLNSLFN